MTLTGTHKTRCMICGGKDDLVMQYDGKPMVDLCQSCAIIGNILADRKTMVFITQYVSDCRRMNPGCHYGSEFSNDCIDKFEEVVWLNFFRKWIKEKRRVY
jgi:hypothetical protein